jgi:hypothetical protein
MSPYGKVSSSWERVGDMVIYKVYVPPNTQADLFFDNSVKEVKYENLLVNLSNPYVLEPGYYEFEVY